MPLSLLAQGDKELRAKADALFAEGAYAEAAPFYSQLVSLNTSDPDLNFRYGACSLYNGGDKEKAIGFLKFATKAQDPPMLAWYFLGRANHLSYHFKEALAAYEHYRGTADKKTLAEHPVDALEQQCRNGQALLSNLKDIDVHNKVEVDAAEFFRFYDLGDIGGRIVVTPDELKTSLDKKSKERSLVYLPGKGGPIYFSSLGKDGRTGRDIYRTELLPTGEFATPVKVAGYINTDQDEDFACMSADGRTLYFCSKGHNSMGGYDVFKSLYDASNDVFSAPENLDFAVNTPDDDVLYLVDAEGKEACFASGRDSKQGMLHVYRVSTAQVPINITVLKGTFASQFDAQDRKAHIVVEDAVSREQVADVRTDINGSYVLALPRGGRYKFMVEAGPSARTHVGMVEIPRNTEAKAYRQEMQLIDQGGEKLMIKNYFEEPLQDDLIDLALAEITRRARLDLTTGKPPAAQQPEPEVAGDIITQAGFAGDVTKASAQRMADEDATGLEQAAKAYADQATAAYQLADQNVQEADEAIAEAKRLVAQAQALADEAAKNDLMMRAARERQRSREADLRARAAYRTGQDLDLERTATQQKAITARKVSTDLTTALSANNDATALVALHALKKRMDEKNGPEGTVDVTERLRRNATAVREKAASELQQADALRSEETELRDRIARLEREQSAASGKKKEELGKQVSALREQDGFLVQEVQAAFAKAERAQEEAAVAEGGTELARHLSTNAGPGNGAPLNTATIQALGERVSGTGSRIAAIGVDERYVNAMAAEAQASERRAFDWAAPASGSDVLASTTDPTNTRSADGQASRMNGNTITLPNGSPGAASPVKGGDATALPPTTGAEPDANTAPGQDRTSQGADAANGTAARNADGTLVAPASGNKEVARPATTGNVAADRTAEAGTTDTPAGSANDATAGRGSDVSGTDGGTDANGADRPAATDSTPLTEALPVGTTSPDARGEDGSNSSADGNTTRTNDLASMRGTGAPGTEAPDGQVQQPNAGGPAADAPTPEEQAFVLANELAELRQMRAAEKDKVRQDSLDARIERTRRLMRMTQQAGSVEAQGAEARPTTTVAVERTADGGEGTARGEEARTDVPVNADVLLSDSTLKGPPLVFDTAMAEPQLIERLFASYGTDQARIKAGEGDVRERAQELHGLELMLVDSIDAESARQADALEGAADKGEVLARMDRLRRLKEAHVTRAAQVLAEAEQEYAAMESRRLEDLAIAASNEGGNRPPLSSDREAAAPTPHNDSYVSIARDRERIYESVMDHRSPKVREAVMNKDRDMETMTQLEEQIDSLETKLDETPRGKAWDKLRARTDRMIDDHLIQRTELGQRLAFITRNEYEAAKDSTGDLREAVVRKGLAPGEPLVQMAQRMEEDARTAMDLAGERRKEADRSENIVLRDSLYREAYALELQALRDLDRSLTVRGHMLSDKFTPGSAPSYAEIERAQFGVPDELAWNKGEQGAVAGEGRVDSSAVAATDARPAPATQQRPDYKTFLGPDGKPILSTSEGTDSSSLVLPAEQRAEQARALEDRSVATADRANAVQDSAAQASRREREAIEREAARLRHISDSLHTAAVAGQREAEALEARRRDDAEKAAFAERLRKYYYLTGEEQVTVMNAQDESRYFSITAKAMEQRDHAGEARTEAGTARTLAQALDQQATTLGTDSASVQQQRQLALRAAELRSRADSLTQHADLLERAATVNSSQAALVLQGLPAERSSAIMAMEQRARRTDGAIAQAPASDATPADKPANVPVPANAVARPNDVAGDQGAAPATPATQARPATPATARTEPEPTRTAERVTPSTDPNVGRTTTVTRPSVSEVAPGGIPATLPPLTGDVFSMDNSTARQGAIPIDAPMPAGIVFKVQVGAFRKQVSDEAFKDMTPVTGETVGNGLTRYTAGMFTSASSAAQASEQVRARGYRDAFVVAYQDGRRIPVAQAMALTSPAVAQAPAPARSENVVRPASELPAVSSGATEDAAVLNNYAASAQEVLAAFKPAPEATAYYNDPTAAPANQVEAIKGLFFTVQVGVYSKPTALDKLFNITPLNSERTENNKIRYTTGVFLDLENARVRKDATVGLGVKDAFITAYLNGKRIPMRDARALLAKFGASILADPTNLKR